MSEGWVSWALKSEGGRVYMGPKGVRNQSAFSGMPLRRSTRSGLPAMALPYVH